MKQLKIIAIAWGLLLLVIFSVLTYFALQWKNKTYPYLAFEDELVSKTKSYFESAHQYPNKGDKVVIKFDELKENSVVNTFSVNDDECDGYVVVKNKGVIEYKAYIKCNNYTTKDFEKNN